MDDVVCGLKADQEFFTKNWPLICWAAKRAFKAMPRWVRRQILRWYEWPDVKQQVALQVIRKADRYDPSKGAVSNFVRMRARIAMSDLAAKIGVIVGPTITWKLSEVSRIARNRNLDQEHLGSRHVGILDESGPLEEEEVVWPPPFVAKVWRSLDSRYEKVVTGIYRDNATLLKLASELGISRERVRQIEARAIYRLRNNLSIRGVKHTWDLP